MSCINGRIEPDVTTKYRLFSDSCGYCQRPNCREYLFKDLKSQTIHIGEVAHIIAAQKGPRKSSQISDNNKAHYDNLILLCPSCHTEIDKSEMDYPANILISWKKDLKKKIEALFYTPRVSKRIEARESIVRIQRENKIVFLEYGPNGPEKYNPESSQPVLWEIKMKDVIIPNNRRILSLCDVNEHLLTEEERIVIEKFRQHIADLEIRHLFDQAICGKRYPEQMDQLFSEGII